MWQHLFLIVSVYVLFGVDGANGTSLCEESPCPPQYATQLAEITESMDKNCKPQTQKAFKVCDIEADEDIKQKQLNANTSFKLILNSSGNSKNIKGNCNSYGYHSQQLGNTLSRFIRDCTEHRGICIKSCQESYDEAKELQKKLASMVCCQPVHAEVTSYIDDTLIPWLRTCDMTREKIEKGNSEYAKWKYQQSRANQCNNLTSENITTQADNGNNNTGNPTNNNQNAPPANGSTKDQLLKIFASDMQKPKSVEGKSGETSNSKRRGSNATASNSKMGSGSSDRGKLSDSTKNQVVKEILNDILGPEYEQNVGKASANDSNGQTNYPGSANMALQPDSQSAQSSKETDAPTFSESTTESEAEYDSNSGFLVKKVKGQSYHFLPLSTKPKIKNNRRVMAQTEPRLDQGITPAQGPSLWQKITERYRETAGLIKE